MVNGGERRVEMSHCGVTQLRPSKKCRIEHVNDAKCGRRCCGSTPRKKSDEIVTVTQVILLVDVATRAPCIAVIGQWRHTLRSLFKIAPT